jgi:hypothetical protein
MYGRDETKPKAYSRDRRDNMFNGPDKPAKNKRKYYTI